MDPTFLRQILDDIVRDLDAGRVPARNACFGVASVVAMGLAGCPHQQVALYAGPPMPQAEPEAITPALAPAPVPTPVPPDVSPPKEVDCRDGLDNDGDGHIDCLDPSCFADEACIQLPVAVYGPPPIPQDIKRPPIVPGPEVCSDGIDNDLNGLIDCDDPKCTSLSDCQEQPVLYAAP